MALNYEKGSIMKILKFLTVFVAVLAITFSVPAAVLAAPAPVYPTNGQLIYTYSSGFAFQWSSAGSMATTSYDIEISTDPTFTNTAPSVMVDSNDGNHATSNCGSVVQPTNYTSVFAYHPATTYYWRIQSYVNSICTGGGATAFVTGGSGWAVYSFRTAITAPTLTAPVGITLSDNLHNDSSTTPPHPLPLFKWTAITGASGYILQVSTVATFSSLYINTSVSASATYDGGAHIGYSPTSDITAHTTFYWRVETLNSTYGPSAWSSAPASCISGYCTFTSANVSAAPVPLSISQALVYKTPTGKVTTDLNPGLRWQSVAVPSGATFSTYQVQASADPKFLDDTKLCFDVNSTNIAYLANLVSLTAPDLTTAQIDTQEALAAVVPGVNCPFTGSKFNPTSTIYWRVRAVFTGPSYTDWSTAFSFKTSYLKPVALTTSVDPTNPHVIRFAWTYPGSSQLPYGYQIGVGFDAALSSGQVVIAKSNVNSGFGADLTGHPYNIPAGTTMWFSVRATGPYGPGLWQNAVSFVVP